jgi:prophage regulatory protein
MPVDKFLRIGGVLTLTGLARSSLYAMVKAGTFPRPLKLSARSSAWSELAVRHWMESKKPRNVEAA